MSSVFRYRAWLGLGGNLGDPIVSMAAVLQNLDSRPDCHIESVSPVYLTPPWGNTDQADFFNSCAAITTNLEPLALIKLCLEIERELKRVRNERWGPRTIDVDILAMQDSAGKLIELDDERLQIPHPRMLDRAFVLVPLADIAPDLEIGGHSIKEWSERCDLSGIKKARTSAGWWKTVTE